MTKKKEVQVKSVQTKKAESTGKAVKLSKYHKRLFTMMPATMGLAFKSLILSATRIAPVDNTRLQPVT